MSEVSCPPPANFSLRGTIHPGLPKELLPGNGTVLAVLGSGIQQNHCAFSNSEVPVDEKVLKCKNFINPDEDCEDAHGFGTECAALACGLICDGLNKKGSPIRFYSYAPGARLMVCKVTLGPSFAEFTPVMDALKYIIDYNSKDENQDKLIDVVSLSLAAVSFNKDFALAVSELVAKDIIMVCSASNDGANLSNPIAYPGCLGHVLCIGACDESGKPTKFSSEGREIDFVELGQDVLVPTISIGKDLFKMTVRSGTAYSTPIVAGIICALLQDLKRLSTGTNQSLWKKMHNVWCMRDLLKSMTVMQGYHDSAKGYGRLLIDKYFKKGDEERIRICNEILGGKN